MCLLGNCVFCQFYQNPCEPITQLGKATHYLIKRAMEMRQLFQRNPRNVRWVSLLLL